MAKQIRFMFTGGGTGGHLFPAIAAAEALCKRMPGSKVLFVGTKRKMDQQSLEQYGFAVQSIHSQGLKGKDVTALLQGVLLLPISIIEALQIIIRFKPDLVFGVGGYVTGPVILAARMLGKTTLIHEQNSIPGLANKKLGRLATRVCLSMPGSESFFPREKSVLTGNPVRQAILELSEKQIIEKSGGKKTLLVLGGSLGAHRVNQLVVEAFSHLDPGSVKVIHQTGPRDVEFVKLAYTKLNVEATVQPFFRDMATIYEQADFLVSRAGATTLAELAVLGKPAILIPYPYAADNHQEKNAAFYVQRGGALLLIERKLTGEKLGEQLTTHLFDPTLLEHMGKAMKSCAFPDATEKIVDECIACLIR